MKPVVLKMAFLFSLLWPTFLEGKKVDVTAIDENQMFTYLLEADKTLPRMHLPDGAQLDEKVIDQHIEQFRAAAVKVEDPAFKNHMANLDKLLEAAKVQPIKPVDPPAPAKANIADDPALKALEARVAQAEQKFCESLLANKLGESKLPIPLQEAVREIFTDPQGKIKVFQESDLTLAIDRTRKTWGKMQAGAGVNAMGLDVKPGKDELDKIQLGLDGFFLKSSLKPLTMQESKDLLQGVTPMRSIKEGYVLLTGDTDVTGMKKNSRRFTESLITTDWGEVVASAMNKALVRDYNMIDLQQFRDIVDVVPVKDFKTQRRLRVGGYLNLPAVAQRGTYLPLASPTDEEATYVPTKRGGTEDLTIEMIKNDDVGAVQKIPQKLARAAIQTLHEFVFDMIIPSLNTESVGSPPNIYDGIALYHTTHANKFTAVLAADAIALNAARLAMKKFTNKDNSKRLGIRAGFLITPSDLESINYGLTMPAAGNANLVPTFAQKLGLKPIVVDSWTDATDWVLAAKREDVTGIELGFLDGKEEPELFVSDQANVGSLFTNDVITYKLRHIYGGAVIDYRAFVGSVVAG